MVRKNDHSAIRVLHLYVAGLCGVLRQTRAAKGLRVLACLRGAGASYSKLNHFAIPYFVRLRYGDLGSGLFAVRLRFITKPFRWRSQALSSGFESRVRRGEHLERRDWWGLVRGTVLVWFATAGISHSSFHRAIRSRDHAAGGIDHDRDRGQRQ